MDGKSGVVDLGPDFSELPVHIAGKVQDFTISPNLLSGSEASRYDRFVHFALHAANEAIEHSRLKDSGYSPEEMGCLLGVGMGGFPAMESSHKNFLEKGSRRVSPFFIPSVIPNMASGLVSIRFGLRGINLSVASACASSGHALGLAYNEIALGRQKVIVAGGTEAVVTPLTISGFANMKALSRRNQNPTEASRPFDQDRDGFVMGEGAGILVLENREEAIKRGVPILAELVGVGASSDAFHITAPHSEGIGAIAAMNQAIAWAGLEAKEIDYINAHGTSTPLGDLAETLAIKKVLGTNSSAVSVSSTKSMTGHLLGAASGVESIFCIMALQHQTVPPTINLEKPGDQLDLDYTPHVPKKKALRYALNNSFGFGGTNSCLIFAKGDL